MREKKTWEVGVARIVSASPIESLQILASLGRIEAKLDKLLAQLPGKRPLTK